MAPKLNINQLPIKYYIFSEYFIMKIYISLVLIDKTYQTISITHYRYCVFLLDSSLHMRV